jgi:Tol biopolymer transport system component
MALPAGTLLGPYEIVGQIGAGGMGEVYRARDVRLGREVAIKVLPAAVASDADRLKRFEKEARSASALNHPSIVTIHDIGASGGTSYIAMELVNGQTLRELLAEGAIPPKRLLAIAAPVADGLANAHGAGLVHRDLKPENIMVTKDGFVKILDFGLAKLTQPEDPGGATQSPTVSDATGAGIVMGTVGYMSPEQALAKPLDFRSDQFALGSILYEMATGKRAFARPSVPETLTAILRDEPEPIGNLSPLTPTPLRWIVERCLAKAADDRYASTRDLARDLATVRDRMGETSAGAGVTAVVPAPRAAWPRVLPWVLAVALAGSLAYRTMRTGPRAAGAVPVRFSIVLPEGVDFENGEIEGQSSLSPDGRKLVFVGGAAGRRRLYLRSLDALDARPIEGTDSAVSPFWSPDSLSIGFFADGKLQRKEISGGPAKAICDAPFLETLPSWGAAGQILFAQLGPQKPGIYVVSAGGGEPRRLVYSGGAENFGVWPHFLPDGKRFLYVTRDFDKAQDRRWYLRAGSTDSNKTTGLGETMPSRIEYAQPGYLIFGRAGALLAQPFDAAKLRFTGEAVTLAEHVYYFNGPANTGFSASQAGVLSYERLGLPSRVAWLDRSGRQLEAIGLDGIVSDARLSPDGRMVALSIRDEKLGTADLWLYDLSRRLATRLTLDEGDDRAPVWSNDGQRIYFRSDRGGPPDLYVIPATSPGQEKILLRRPGIQQPDDVSADGRFLSFTDWSRRTNKDIMLLPLSGEGEPVPIAQTPIYEAGARFSPDGAWIAYVSNESGAREIYLRPVNGGGERIRVSSSGGDLVRWRRDGRELFYLSSRNEIMAVPVAPGARPDPGVPRAIFHLEGDVRDYDVAADGQRFLVDSAPSDPAPITVLVNWPALVAR